ncbi:MAG: DUF4214 domain-containing protein, partial [Ruminiclostridium sp.]|nr:DUF4214 domain-containing protein [Ruminiclostridium sp.]
RYINIYSESNESSTQSEYSVQEEYSVQDNSNSIEAYSVDPSDSPYEYNADFYVHSVYPLDNYDKIDCFSTKENNTTYFREYDLCTIDGHQTFFITKKDGSDIDMSSIMLELDAKITSLLVYNETEGKMTDVCTEPQDFSKNNTIHYSFTNSKGQKKHYWITVNAVNEGGAKLFVDGPSERTVYFNACYGWTHDILIANTGDEPLTGLSVTLTDAKNIKLDEYWTVGGAKNDTLAPFTTSDKSKMANLANIRLLPNGNDGEIGGTLTIKADGQKDVVIKLSGKAGNPGLAIDEELEAVKYVPYSIKFETDNTFAWNEFVSYTLYGDLPEGMTYNESTGEIYGVPLETGTFDLNVMTQFSVTGHNNKSFKLEIKENTEENVRKVTAGGYAIKKALGRVSMGIYYLSDTAEDQLFVSEGEFSEFIDLWLNGVKLQSGDDYTAVEGSTSITLSSELLQTLETDSKNTIVAEFREGGTLDGALICTAQNFTFAEATPVEQFVERLYVTMLGRASDPTGKANHVSSLENGKTAAEVSAKFVTSAELKSKNLSNDEFVLRMYQTFMNRTPSANEITRWATTLENGCTYEYVLKKFVASAEFKNLCAEYGITAGTYEPENNRDYDENITAFVSRMYTTLLGRSFDANGLNNNAGIIINGGTAADVGKKFVMSGELTNLKLSNDEFVKRMYQTFLNRTPSAKEITRWATTL